MWQKSKSAEPAVENQPEDAEVVAGEQSASDEELNTLEQDLNSDTNFDLDVEGVE